MSEEPPSAVAVNTPSPDRGVGATGFDGVVLLTPAGTGADNYYGPAGWSGARFPAWFSKLFMSGDPNPPAALRSTTPSPAIVTV